MNKGSSNFIKNHQEHFIKMGSKFFNNKWDIDDENMMNYHAIWWNFDEPFDEHFYLQEGEFLITFHELFEVLLMNFVHQNYDEPFMNIWTWKCSWKFRRRLCLICCWWTSDDIWWIWPELLMNVHVKKYMNSTWSVNE